MNALATIEELKRRLNTTGGGGAGADDELLQELLDAAADRFTDLARDRTLAPLPALEDAPDPEDPQVDTADPVSKTFPVYGAIVQVPDLRAVESVTYGETELALAPGGYALRTPAGDGENLRYLRVRLRNAAYGALDDPSYVDLEPGELTIVGRWGPRTVEPRVRDAVLTWAARAWHARSARFADAVQDPAGGTVSSYFKAVPADVAVVLNALQVPGL